MTFQAHIKFDIENFLSPRQFYNFKGLLTHTLKHIHNIMMVYDLKSLLSVNISKQAILREQKA